MALTRVDSSSTLDSTTASTIDLSDAVTAGSTNAFVELKNVSDFPVTVSRRETGDSVWVEKQLQPSESYGFIATLTAARTLDYKVGEGEIWAYVGYFWGTGLSASLGVSDIRAYLLGYDSDITDAQITVFLGDITAVVTDASDKRNLISGTTINATIKNLGIKFGTAAQCLKALEGKGAQTGLTQDRIIVSQRQADEYQAKYEEMLEAMRMGTRYK